MGIIATAIRRSHYEVLMFARLGRTLALILALSLGTVAVAQAEPTLHEVYEAARSGHVAEARQMMKQVLADHPNSAKAHFVAAEIDARAGDAALARQELSAAERLDPSLSFAKPESVQALRRELSGSRGEPGSLAVANTTPSIPWGTILLAVLAIGGVWWMFRRRSAIASGPSAPYSSASLPGSGPLPAGPMGYGGVAAPSAGSGLLGSLATGMAVGAGVVAGEEIVRHMMEPSHHATADQWSAPPAEDLSQNPDMGGSDFGVNDAGSWDVGGGDDWS